MDVKAFWGIVSRKVEEACKIVIGICFYSVFLLSCFSACNKMDAVITWMLTFSFSICNKMDAVINGCKHFASPYAKNGCSNHMDVNIFLLPMRKMDAVIT